MPRISISFDPAQDTEEEVFAHVAAIYGVDVAPVALREEDRPDTGAGAPTAGADAPATLGLDIEGLPWDARIHAKSQTKNADGTWRKGKNLAAGAYDGIVAELRKTHPAPAPAPAGNPALPNVTSAGTATIIPATVPVQGTLALPPITPPALTLPPAAPVLSAYAQFVEFLVSHTQSVANPTGLINEAWISETMRQFGFVDKDGVGSVTMLQHAEDDKIAVVRNSIAKALGVA